MITLHRRSNGTFLTSIRAKTDRSWVVNNKGKCTIYMSAADEKVIRKYMGQRNLIYIGHDELPGWGGIIETDQDWDEGGGVQFVAWSGESLLLSRSPSSGELLSATSPGALFAKLIAKANEPEYLNIRMGTVYLGGGPAETTLDGTNIFELISDLAERWDMEWSITPVLNAKQTLSFEANWYLRQGVRVEYQLSEGHNIRKTSKPYKTRKRVVNELTGFGEGHTDERPKYTEVNEQSRALYGLIQGVENYDGVVNESTVKMHVQKRLKVLRRPREIVSVVALNKPGCFARLRLGNTYPFKATSFGFQSSDGVGLEKDIRVVGMRYLETLDECEIINNTEENDE